MRGVRKIFAITAVAAGLPFVSAQAFAATSTWDHNGSLMRFEENGQKRRFLYEQPRDNLGAAGVHNGTVLFDGEEKKDGRLAGYAKLFRKGCDPVDYFVEGAYDKNKGEILLQGQAPIYSGQGCKITGYTEDGSASSLLFSMQSGGSDRYVARGEDIPSDRVTPDRYDSDRQASGSYAPPPADDPADRTAPDRYDTDRQASRSYAPPADDPADRTAPDRYDTDRRASRSYAPPADERADQEPAYGGDPRYTGRNPTVDEYPSRDYAYRRDRFGRDSRYDGSYYSGPSYADQPDNSDYYNDDEEDLPAYSPFQPRWRRF